MTTILRGRGAVRVLLGLLLSVATATPTLLGQARSVAAAGKVAPGRVIVKMRDGASAARSAAASYGALAVESAPALGGQVWTVPAGSEQDVARRASARADVEYAEPDQILRLKQIPNDTLFGSYQWNLPKVNATQAWDSTTGDPGVTVAVIDSGFDTTHPDRPANLRLGCDYVTWGTGSRAASCPPVSSDPNGHGTHVAGIVAARQNNAVGISGLAPNVTLLAIRTADGDGESYLSNVSSAIREATDSGARVINLSLGGPGSARTMQSAVEYAMGRGVVVVAAAGNEYEQGNTISYPAAYPGVIAVGSASDNDEHASFSNTGDYVSIVAPGGSASGSSDGDPRHWIVSLYPVEKGSYQMVDGTSQASPHVAATAGLVLSVRPSLRGSDVATLLKSTARPLGTSRPNPTFGWGYLDAGAAVRAAQQYGAAVARSPTPQPANTPAPTALPTSGAPLPAVTGGMKRSYVPSVGRVSPGL